MILNFANNLPEAWFLLGLFEEFSVGKGFGLLPFVWLSTWKIQWSNCLNKSVKKNFTIQSMWSESVAVPADGLRCGCYQSAEKSNKTFNKRLFLLKKDYYTGMLTEETWHNNLLLHKVRNYSLKMNWISYIIWKQRKRKRSPDSMWAASERINVLNYNSKE